MPLKELLSLFLGTKPRWRQDAIDKVVPADVHVYPATEGGKPMGQDEPNQAEKSTNPNDQQ